MSVNHTTVEELRATFDEKLAPLKVEIDELRYFILKLINNSLRK